jgi:transposase
VKRERLDFLADNARYTKRFAYYVGRRCRSATIKDIAKELHLSWDAVKELEKQYMRAQLARAGTPGPKRIGIDEISIRKRHVYRIVVSDLDRARPIWFGGEDRSEASMAQFYAWLGEKKSRRIKLALMDMWKPFRNATEIHAPQAAILFDKFHVMRHLGKALDQVRKTEYARLSGKDRRFIKGQKYTLLSNRENLSLEGKKALKALLSANKRLNTAYLLKESFGQLWDYQREGWARRFFENWRAALKWQRLEPYQKFRRDDRSSLGRHRRVLPAREQSLTWLRRGTEQQDPRASETRLWPARRGIPATEDPHLHAPAPLKPCESTHTFPGRPIYRRRSLQRRGCLRGLRVTAP